MLDPVRQVDVETPAQGVEACRRECAYFPVCGGGSPSNKLAETGRFDGTETLYCRLTVKTVTDLMLAKLAEGEAPALKPAAAALAPEPSGFGTSERS